MQRTFYYAVQISELPNVEKARQIFEGMPDEQFEWLRARYTADIAVARQHREPEVPCSLYPDRVTASHSRGIIDGPRRRPIREDDFLWEVMQSDAGDDDGDTESEEQFMFYVVSIVQLGEFKGQQSESTEGVIMVGDLIDAYAYAELLLRKKAEEIKNGNRTNAGAAARPATDVIN